MKPLKIQGWNDFYDGWLYAVLLQPIPEDATEAFREGYQMAMETGVENAIEVLQDEISLKHIVVS